MVKAHFTQKGQALSRKDPSSEKREVKRAAGIRGRSGKKGGGVHGRD